MHSLCVLLTYMPLSAVQNECFTTMPLLQIYVAVRNKSYVGIHVNCPMLCWKNENFICSRLCYDCNAGLFTFHCV